MRCTALLVLAATATACESRALVQTPQGDESFVAVAREAQTSRDQMTFAPATAIDPGDSFYLAIHKRELDSRWFLSAYLTQYFPDAVLGGAAVSMGTRVVSFKLQNDKLVVFDVDDNKQSSDTFGTDTIVDAYPVVQESGDYVVIDPAAGLNRFGVLGDAFGRGGYDRFMVEVAFSQRFRRISDGVTWEEALTGYTDKPYRNLDRTEPNQFRASAVLGLSLRRYHEGEGFTPVPYDGHYFYSNPFVVTDAGYTSARATKWNIHEGGKPIRWLIAPAAVAAAETPAVKAAGIDLIGAIKTGIESWNAVFGFPALEAALAGPDDSFGDDDKNYLIYDVNPAVQFAFADWRTNPNTGEIRGASVYFNDVFVQDVLAIFFPDLVVAAPAVRPAPSAAIRQLTWLPFDHPKICHLQPAAMDPLAAGLTGPGTPATAHEQAEKYLAHVIAHEVGHTLGLRHNFKGSLVPPSSSIMDYLNVAETNEATIPASYDAAAVLALYGGPAPTQPFCTDELVGVDPLCQQFDAAADPLRTWLQPRYQRYADRYLASGSPLDSDGLDYYLARMLEFAQRGAPPDAADGYTLAVAPVKAPLDGDKIAAADPGYLQRINDISQRLYGGLVTSPDPMVELPPLDAGVTGQLVPDLTANLLNVDAIRTYETRRLTIDVLKKVQLLSAYTALRGARQNLVAVPATGDERALLDDLVARIDKAVTPYFDK